MKNLSSYRAHKVKLIDIKGEKSQKIGHLIFFSAII